LGSSCIKKEIVAWQIWAQLPVEALIPEHPKANSKFMNHLKAAKAKYDQENSAKFDSVSINPTATLAAVAPILE
jgi:hypothetical protein